MNFPECMQLLSYLRGGTEEPYRTALDYAVRFMTLVQKATSCDLMEVIEYSERLDKERLEHSCELERREALKGMFRLLPGGKGTRD